MAIEESRCVIRLEYRLRYAEQKNKFWLFIMDLIKAMESLILVSRTVLKYRIRFIMNVVFYQTEYLQ